MWLENEGTSVERRSHAPGVAAQDESTQSHKVCSDSKYICGTMIHPAEQEELNNSKKSKRNMLKPECN